MERGLGFRALHRHRPIIYVDTKDRRLGAVAKIVGDGDTRHCLGAWLDRENWES